MAPVGAGFVPSSSDAPPGGWTSLSIEEGPMPVWWEGSASPSPADMCPSSSSSEPAGLSRSVSGPARVPTPTVPRSPTHHRTTHHHLPRYYNCIVVPVSACTIVYLLPPHPHRSAMPLAPECVAPGLKVGLTLSALVMAWSMWRWLQSRRRKCGPPWSTVVVLGSGTDAVDVPVVFFHVEPLSSFRIDVGGVLGRPNHA